MTDLELSSTRAMLAPSCNETRKLRSHSLNSSTGRGCKKKANAGVSIGDWFSTYVDVTAVFLRSVLCVRAGYFDPAEADITSSTMLFVSSARRVLCSAFQVPDVSVVTGKLIRHHFGTDTD